MAEHLTGVVERITFHNPENGYAVLRVQADGRRGLVTVVGHLPAVYPGEYITCVHDHAKALCERARFRGSEGLPDHGGCKPLACRNVALTPRTPQPGSASSIAATREGRRIRSPSLWPTRCASTRFQRPPSQI